MRVLEVTLFLTLSGALHVAALTLAPSQGGGGAGGENGASDLSLTAASPTLAAMVQDWDRPPETSTAPVLDTPVSPTNPAALTNDTAVSTQRAPLRPSNLANTPTLPNIETRLPAPVVPLAQTDLGSFDAPPAQSEVAALPLAPQSARPKTNPPEQTFPDVIGQDLPNLDTSPTSGQFAPRASLRPEARSERVPRKATPNPKPASTAARPAQKAKGTGKSPTAAKAPQTKAPKASGPSKAQLAQAQAKWGAKIRASVARAQRYPNGTRARGTVKLQLRVSPAGRVVGVSVVQSSGDRRLDKAALTAVKRARLPRAPKGLTAASYRFNLPLSFKR